MVRRLGGKFFVIGAFVGLFVAATLALAQDGDNSRERDVTTRIPIPEGPLPTPVDSDAELANPDEGDGPTSIDRNPPFADVSGSDPTAAQVAICEEGFKTMAADAQLVCKVRQAILEDKLPAGAYSKQELKAAIDP